MNELEGAENTSILQTDSPRENTDSPATSGGSPETSGARSPCSNSEDQLQEQHFDDLLQQYGLNENRSDGQDRRYVGPIRNFQPRRATMVHHPYERADSREIDLPQILLDLQDAAIRLANGQQAN